MAALSHVRTWMHWQRTPRIDHAEYDGSTSLRIVFKDRMDQRNDDAVFILADQTLGVVEFTNFTWADDFTLESSTGAVLGSYSGPTFVRYMDGDIRAYGAFRLRIYDRTDAVEEGISP